MKIISKYMAIVFLAGMLAGVCGCGNAGKEAKDEYSTLTGRWLRPDGGYILEVKSVDSTGLMAAGYFNPRSINVAKAQASVENTALKVFVELRDVNYPGSTYNLVYNPSADRLIGTYYQAVEKRTFEVFFVRSEKP